MIKTGNTDSILKAMENPTYQGRHIIVASGKVYSAKTGKQASLLFDRLVKKYPNQTLAITYVPKADFIGPF